MKMFDCDICMSAGSVNKWGYCEICGEDFEDTASLVQWQSVSMLPDGKNDGRFACSTVAELTAVSQDAA